MISALRSLCIIWLQVPESHMSVKYPQLGMFWKTYTKNKTRDCRRWLFVHTVYRMKCGICHKYRRANTILFGRIKNNVKRIFTYITTYWDRSLNHLTSIITLWMSTMHWSLLLQVMASVCEKAHAWVVLPGPLRALNWRMLRSRRALHLREEHSYRKWSSNLADARGMDPVFQRIKVAQESYGSLSISEPR